MSKIIGYSAIMGLVGLLYEVSWLRILGFTQGGLSKTMAATVAGVMLGFGLGSYLWFRCPLRPRYRSLAYVELVGAGFALGTAYLLHSLHDFYLLISFGDFSLLSSVIHFLAALTLITPSCLLMGYSLPLLVSVFEQEKSSQHYSALTYGAYSLGGGIGVLFGSYFLLPILGSLTTLLITASVQFLLAILFFKLDRPIRNSLIEKTDQSKLQLNKEILCSYLLGVAALLLQYLWLRQLTILLAQNNLAFAQFLFVYLLGLGVGSLWQGQQPRDYSLSFFKLIIFSFGYIILGQFFFGHFDELYLWLIQFLPLRTELAFGGIKLFLIFFILFPVVFINGRLFPYFIHLVHQKGQREGSSYALINLANSLGAFSSLALGIYFLGEYLKTSWILTAVALVYALLMIIYAPKKLIGVSSIVMILALGLYQGSVSYNLISQNFNSLLYYGENATTAVFVSEEKDQNQRAYRQLHFHDGRGTCSTQREMVAAQRSISLIALANLPNPNTVLDLGLGCGNSSSLYLELSEALLTGLDVTKHLLPALSLIETNFDLVQNKRFHFIAEDGRHYLYRTHKKFDIIQSMMSSPRISPSSAYHTSEFFELVRSKLKPNGLFVHALVTDQLDDQHVQMALRTWMKNFENFVAYKTDMGMYFFGRNGELPLDGKVSSDLLTQFEIEIDEFEKKQKILPHQMALWLDREGELLTDKHPRLDYFVTSHSPLVQFPAGLMYQSISGEKTKFRARLEELKNYHVLREAHEPPRRTSFDAFLQGFERQHP